MKKIILISLALLCIPLSTVYAQSKKSKSNLTPGNSFDKIFDRFGTEYQLKDLRIKPESNPPTGEGERLDDVVIPAKLLCSPGIFNVYFEQGSGCEQNAFPDNARRAVICQVFTDLSNFLVPADPDVKVNILVKNIENLAQYPGNTGILGVATSFYTVPANAGVAGILDGQVWKTINSGVDAYKNVTSPLITNGSTPSGAFYHGMMAFNFRNQNIQWHTDLTTPTAQYTYDLYSTVLHEVTHALGFASLINSTGGSNFGPNYNYYSRYDLFLEDFAGNALIAPTTACDMYGHSFNTAPANLAPQNPVLPSCVTDKTYCIQAVKFAGTVTQEVYSPNCFEPGSSLSHFEDQCHQVNNQYFCMSNAAGSGSTFMTRYLKPEERDALCDLGYMVNTAYGNMLYVDNFYNYGGTQCPGTEIAGVNDGINSNGSYTWTTPTVGTVNFSGFDLLGNDYNADEFECLEVVNGLGTVSVTNGNSTTSVTFTAGATNGIALLRYIPLNTTTGNKGNITYLYVSINETDCEPTACNMVINNGFENGTNCGEKGAPDLARIFCWDNLIETPDYYVRGCTPTTDPNKTLPTGTAISNPATDAWNGSSAGNDAFVGLGFYNGADEEALQSMLSNPMQPGVSYTLSFWAKSASSTAFTGSNTVMFRSDASFLAPLPTGSFSTTGQYLTETVVKGDNEWHYYTLVFTYNGVGTGDNLLIGNLGNTSGLDSYVFIDDISLYPTNDVARFDAHPALCEGVTTIDDLSQFIFPAMPAGATFSGPGVQFSGGIYSFVAPSNGKFTIFYNFTNSNGCSISIPSQIYVTPNTRPNVGVISNPVTPPAVWCGTSVTLRASGAEKYDWYSPFAAGANMPCTGNCETLVVTPTAPGYLFVVIGTDSIGCKDTNEIYVHVQCGAPSGGSYEMPDNVKHYTTKMVPGTRGESIMVGTIFGAGGNNKIHFMRLASNGSVLKSVEYPSAYIDERAVDVQHFVDLHGDEMWYIVAQARTGGMDIIKVLAIDADGTLLGQREYSDPTGLDYYPMHSTTWSNGDPMNEESRLYICGFQPDNPLGGGLPDYNTRKHAFVVGIDINLYSPTYLQVMMSQGYDWMAPGGSQQDFDMATRIAVVEGTTDLWVTGSVNGIKPIFIPGNPTVADERSATMNLVIDQNGAVLSDQPFISNSGSDDGSGPLEYGIDLIQTNGEKYILGNKALIQGNFVPGHPQSPQMLYPRANLIWYIEPVDAAFTPNLTRQEFANPWGHWASHAIPNGDGTITVATLIEWQYSTCIPLPFTPNYDNIQVNLVEVDLGAWNVNKSVVYMTSSGTGNPFGAPPDPNSFYDLGGPLSVIDYPPTFAAKGGDIFVINAPKYDAVNQRLNLKALMPLTTNLYVKCGYWDVMDPSNCTNHNPWFIPDPISLITRQRIDIPIQALDNLSANVDDPYIIPGPVYKCFDQHGNPTYRYAAPSLPQTEVEESKKLTVYPNPATTSFFIDIPVKEATTYTIDVYDITGRKVLGKTVKGENNPTFEINTSSFADGTYMVKVQSEGVALSETKKIIVMRNK